MTHDGPGSDGHSSLVCCGETQYAVCGAAPNICSWHVVYTLSELWNDLADRAAQPRRSEQHPTMVRQSRRREQPVLGRRFAQS